MHYEFCLFLFTFFNVTSRKFKNYICGWQVLVTLYWAVLPNLPYICWYQKYTRPHLALFSSVTMWSNDSPRTLDMALVVLYTKTQRQVKTSPISPSHFSTSLRLVTFLFPILHSRDLMNLLDQLRDKLFQTNGVLPSSKSTSWDFCE